jgi:ASCH domain
MTPSCRQKARSRQQPARRDTGRDITHALVIMKKPIDKILAGTKTWEIRSTATGHRGPIGLIESKTGHVVGTCKIVDVEGPLTLAKLQRNSKNAGFRPSELPYRKTYAWIVRNARRLRQPIPYRHRSGAVIWVRLDPGVIRRLRSARARDRA